MKPIHYSIGLLPPALSRCLPCSATGTPPETPRNGQGTTETRVTQLSWNHDEQSVTNMFKDFGNGAGDNLQLWLSGDISLYYAGFLDASGCNLLVTPQGGLNLDNTAYLHYSPIRAGTIGGGQR
ncbi:hypothetical protein VTK26DRAFT_6027 [Humicola hyalothermophila]